MLPDTAYFERALWKWERYKLEKEQCCVKEQLLTTPAQWWQVDTRTSILTAAGWLVHVWNLNVLQRPMC
jgi:hypothetical protein